MPGLIIQTNLLTTKTQKNDEKKIDFNAELLEWFSTRMKEATGNKPDEISRYCLDLDEAIIGLVQIVYQLNLTMPDKAKRTADFFGLSRRTVYRYAKKQKK